MLLSLFVPLDNLVSKEHPYRKFINLLDFERLTNRLKGLENTKVGRHGYRISMGFRMLLLQYVEDLSDRELERYLQENLAAKLFCDFSLDAVTPDFSYFSKLRRKIGTQRLAELFNEVREALKQQGVIREVFTFVDSSQLISKLSVWEERDKAIKAGLEKFNNIAAPKVCKDPQARLGCPVRASMEKATEAMLKAGQVSNLMNRSDRS